MRCIPHYHFFKRIALEIHTLLNFLYHYWKKKIWKSCVSRYNAISLKSSSIFFYFHSIAEYGTFQEIVGNGGNSGQKIGINTAGDFYWYKSSFWKRKHDKNHKKIAMYWIVYFSRCSAEYHYTGHGKVKSKSAKPKLDSSDGTASR